MSILWNQELTQQTYFLYGARFYNNQYGRWNEFFNDIKLFQRCSKLLVSKRNSDAAISIKSILNTYVTLGNVFSGDSLARLGFFLSNPICHSDIKTILYFMYRLPCSIPEVCIAKIPFNTEILSILNGI